MAKKDKNNKNGKSGKSEMNPFAEALLSGNPVSKGAGVAKGSKAKRDDKTLKTVQVDEPAVTKAPNIIVPASEVLDKNIQEPPFEDFAEGDDKSFDELLLGNTDELMEEETKVVHKNNTKSEEKPIGKDAIAPKKSSENILSKKKQDKKPKKKKPKKKIEKKDKVVDEKKKPIKHSKKENVGAILTPSLGSEAEASVDSTNIADDEAAVAQNVGPVENQIRPRAEISEPTTELQPKIASEQNTEDAFEHKVTAEPGVPEESTKESVIEPTPGPTPEIAPESEAVEPDNTVSFANQDDSAFGNNDDIVSDQSSDESQDKGDGIHPGLVAGGLGAAAGAAGMAAASGGFDSTDSGNKSEWDKMKDQIKEDHDKTEQDLNAPSQAGGDSQDTADLQNSETSQESEEMTNGNLPKMGAFVAAALGGAALGAGVAGAASDNSSSDEPLEGEVTNDGESGAYAAGAIGGNDAEMEDEDAEREEVFRIIKKYVGTGCVVIILLIAIFLFQIPQRIFGVVSDFIAGDGSQTETIVENEEDKPYTVSGNGTSAIRSIFVIGRNRGVKLENFDSGVQAALLTGDDKAEATVVSGAIVTGFVVGITNVDFQNTDRIATYMNILMRLQNAFSTDIHQMFNNSPNRTVTLEAHISELDSLQMEATTTLREINEKKDNLKINFNEVTALKEKLEIDFFVAVEKLEGNKANYLLEEFIDTSKRQTDLKAEYNALNKLAELFDYAILNMNARIKDIKYNREALIKGVQVIDIIGSDLELIIQEVKL